MALGTRYNADCSMVNLSSFFVDPKLADEHDISSKKNSNDSFVRGTLLALNEQGRAQDFSQVWAEFFRNKKTEIRYIKICVLLRA